jgi:phage protein D
MPVPTFSIFTGAGDDITGKLRGGGMSMSITDGDGLNADSLQITVDDINGSVNVPPTGAALLPRGGYKGGAVRDYGVFIVDQITLSGFPQQISISAQALAAKQNGKRKEPKDYRKEEYPTFGDVFAEIASQGGWSLSIAGSIASIPNEYVAKGEEEYIEFASRLGRRLDAAVAVKSGRLVVVERGSGMAVSGAAMPTIFIAKGVNLISYQVSMQDAPKHSSVEATWYDRRKNKRMVEMVPGGSEGPPYLMRSPFQSASEAKLAATAQANELKRAEATANFTIKGDPAASGGSFVQASGIRAGVDGRWFARTVTHNYSASQDFQCTVECELPTAGGATAAVGFGAGATVRPTTAGPQSVAGATDNPTLLIDEQ